MRLEQLNILNYRNISEANIEFSPNINCLIGFNGMGKTNILDAIYCLSFGKSEFTNIDSLNIKHNEDFLMIQGTYQRLNQIEQISCGLKRGQKKHIKRNKKEYQRLSDHIGLLPLVIISPKDSELINDGSEQRRRFIDSVISQTNKPYLQQLIAYNQLLKQRNSLLKNDNLNEDLLEVIDLQMGQYAQEIFAIRKQFVEQFTPIFKEIYAFISSNYEQVGIEYASHLEHSDLYSDLQHLRDRDHILGYTTHGIHKDELQMTLDGYPLRNVGSQGQQKTYLLALKLAQFEFLKRAHQFNPLLLLDDIFDKLDTQRVSRIVELVNTDRFGQIFITDTNLDHIDEILKPIVLENKLFEVKDGAIRTIN